jgi:hypothetical protein
VRLGLDFQTLSFRLWWRSSQPAQGSSRLNTLGRRMRHGIIRPSALVVQHKRLCTAVFEREITCTGAHSNAARKGAIPLGPIAMARRGRPPSIASINPSPLLKSDANLDAQYSCWARRMENPKHRPPICHVKGQREVMAT